MSNWVIDIAKNEWSKYFETLFLYEKGVLKRVQKS